MLFSFLSETKLIYFYLYFYLFEEIIMLLIVLINVFKF